ncbi:MAG: 50S ribosomal protein L10 [Zestosphaera sp.]
MKSSTKSRLFKLMAALEEGRKPERKAVRKSIKEKEALISEIKSLAARYNVIGLIDLEGVPSREFGEIKKTLRRYGEVRVFKDTLVKRALEELGLPGAREFVKCLTGSNLLIFTNLNAFMLANIVERVVILRYVKPGEKAPSDIYVPEGPTGIPPGPMMSVFGKLKLRTMVKEGIIWVAKESKVASAGDVVSPELASLLRRLEIKAYPVRLTLKVVLDEGILIPKERLKLNLEDFRNELLSAIHLGRTLAVEALLPLPEVLPEILSNAYLRATLLASEAGYLTRETASIVLRSVVCKALTLANLLMQKQPELDLPVVAQAVAPEVVQTPQKPREMKEAPEAGEEEKKEVSEEEIAEGISSLFG